LHARIQNEIAAWIQAGHTLDEIEASLINSAPASEEGRAALWLYAWALRDGCAGARRRAVWRNAPRARPRTLSAVR
jgi:hypothetical protein